MTVAAEKPYPLGPHIPIYQKPIQGSTPPPPLLSSPGKGFNLKFTVILCVQGFH